MPRTSSKSPARGRRLKTAVDEVDPLVISQTTTSEVKRGRKRLIDNNKDEKTTTSSQSKPKEKAEKASTWSEVCRLLFTAFLGYMYLFESNFFILFYIFSTFLLYSIYRLVQSRLKQSFFILSLYLLILTMLPFILHSAFRLTFDDYSNVEFTRVGLVNGTSVWLFVRYPPVSQMNATDAFDLKLFYKHSDFNEWKMGPSAELTADNDWTSHVRLDQLDNDALYEYSWMYTIQGALIEAQFSLTGRRFIERFSHIGLKPNKPPTKSRFNFKSGPSINSPTHVTIAFGSCLKPNFPYGWGLPGMGLIANHTPDLFLSLGDFIYADAGLFRVSEQHQFKQLYREVMGQDETVALFETGASVLGIVDDHEIRNNWEGKLQESRYDAGMSAFKSYLGQYSINKYYFSFDRGNVAFFLMDTRSFRQSLSKTMLGTDQKEELKQWLLEKNETHTFKIIATSVPFTFNFGNTDTWFGFQEERQEILDFIHDHSVSGVIVLSGDRHQIASVEFVYNDTNTGYRTFEYSVSPINQFNPKVPYFGESFNYPGLSSPKADQKLFPESKWIYDKTHFYTPYGGKFVFGRLEVDTTGKIYPTLKCRSVAILCIFALGDDDGSKPEFCQGSGALIYHNVICLK